MNNHLSFNQEFRDHIKSIFVDGNPIVEKLIDLHPWQYNNHTEIANIILENKDKLQLSFDKMIKSCQANNAYDVLIFLAKGSSKKRIFKILLLHKNEILINRFLENFKNDSEIRALIPFL